MKAWRLLDTPPMSGAENMALDDTLLAVKGRGESPNTIHFLQFSPPVVLVGFHQSIEEEVDAVYCKNKGIDINRRPSGGGAIYLDESQIGWEIICDRDFFDVKVPNAGLYKRLCGPAISAFNELGVKADFRPRNDIEVKGRKISGTGGIDSGDAFMFHGTILVDFDVDRMMGSLKIPVEKLRAKEVDSVRERVTCLKWELGHTPATQEIKEAMVRGFEKTFDITLEPGGLASFEKALFREKVDFYRSSEWINHVRHQFEKKEVHQGIYKAKGGMVRFTLIINPAQKRIKDIYITGDFFVTPRRAMLDLEAKLKGLPADRRSLHATIRKFFEENRVSIVGMECDEFLIPLDKALDKM